MSAIVSENVDLKQCWASPPWAVVGVRAQQIQKYENGKDRIASSRLFLLAAALGVPVSFFFAGLPKAVRTKASSTTLMQRRRNGRH